MLYQVFLTAARYGRTSPQFHEGVASRCSYCGFSISGLPYAMGGSVITICTVLSPTLWFASVVYCMFFVLAHPLYGTTHSLAVLRYGWTNPHYLYSPQSHSEVCLSVGFKLNLGTKDLVLR